MSLNFSVSDVGSNADVGGEWGYGNGGESGNLQNFVSGNTAGLTLFGGANLDGPVNPDGPQAGLVANPVLVALGGLGAIQDEIVATITIDQNITESEIFGDSGLVQVEYGSDAAFIQTPEPTSLVLIVCALATVSPWRRSRR